MLHLAILPCDFILHGCRLTEVIRRDCKFQRVARKHNKPALRHDLRPLFPDCDSRYNDLAFLAEGGVAVVAVGEVGEELVGVFDDEGAGSIEALTEAFVIGVVEEELIVEVVAGAVCVCPFEPVGEGLAFDEGVVVGLGRAVALVAVADDGLARLVVNEVCLPAFGEAGADIADGEFERDAVGGVTVVVGVVGVAAGAVGDFVRVAHAVAVVGDDSTLASL